MNPSLAHIWRYPIKAHGTEALTTTEITKEHTLPWDRVWAVAHEHARLDGGGWVSCRNFSRGASSPKLMAINANWDAAAAKMTVTHPDLLPLTFDPDRDSAAFVAWAGPLVAEGRAASTRLIRADGPGMTDTDFASISLLNLATNRVLSQRAGRTLDQRRWRGNFWIEGLAPWEEFDLVGQTITIGTTAFEVRERITRCKATMVDPETGRRDTDTLGLLDDGWGHQDFGVYLVALENGRVTVGDGLRVAS